VVRTLDAGADKPLPALAAVMGEMREENPALGLRGIRIHLAYPDLLSTQIRALLRAAGATGVALHLMFPMIATVDEWRQARAIFNAALQALQREQTSLPAHTPLGIMVETPAAVMLAEPLAREVAFFSIGTNDLTQYILAADRLNGKLGALYNALQPAVLRAIAQIVQGARAHGRPVAVCGEAGGDPQVAPLLIGLGVGELSMTPASIPLIKETLSRFSSQQLSDLAGRALGLATLQDVQALLSEIASLPSQAQ
jgi:phosphoenolpyruvate-protein kinase (PTS system EI component)